MPIGVPPSTAQAEQSRLICAGQREKERTKPASPFSSALTFIANRVLDFFTTVGKLLTCEVSHDVPHSVPGKFTCIGNEGQSPASALTRPTVPPRDSWRDRHPADLNTPRSELESRTPPSTPTQKSITTAANVPAGTVLRTADPSYLPAYGAVGWHASTYGSLTFLPAHPEGLLADQDSMGPTTPTALETQNDTADFEAVMASLQELDDLSSGSGESDAT